MSEKKVQNTNGLSGYELSRNWFDWCYENPELINPNHAALYFFIIEHYNRLGHKEKFGLPYQMAMDAMGIKSYKTYKKAFDDLADWGFIKIITVSRNQFSANVIALVKNTKANTKALAKASTKHALKHVQSSHQGTVDIDKLRTIEPNNLRTSKSHSGETPAKEKTDLIFWKSFVSVWNEWYQTKFNGSYAYMGKDFAHLKKIYLFLEKRSIEKKFEFTEENLLAAFKYFLNKAWEKDDWLRQNFSIPNVLSQFNQITNAKENGNKKSHQGSNATHELAYDKP